MVDLAERSKQIQEERRMAKRLLIGQLIALVVLVVSILGAIIFRITA